MVNWGIIGYGRMGKQFLQCFNDSTKNCRIDYYTTYIYKYVYITNTYIRQEEGVIS